MIVHFVTRKGYGYAPAENDDADQMHQSRGFDPVTGLARAVTGASWTKVFGQELVALGEQRDDIVAITAAMCEPTGLGEFARRFPDRFYDVGIAEQHAMTSAAGLATGGLHPVVAVYATFLNRAFDQLLMDVALHRLPVTVVLDRAGITGDDGPSHNGMWDLALLGVVPGLRLAAPRDEATLRELLGEAVDVADGPTVLRFPKTPLGGALPALRREGRRRRPRRARRVDAPVDVLARRGRRRRPPTRSRPRPPCATPATPIRVVAPRWVSPVDPAIVELARRPGSSSRSRTASSAAVSGRASRRHSATPDATFPHERSAYRYGSSNTAVCADVRASVGLTVQDIGRRIVEWSARRSPESAADDPASTSSGPHAGEE